MITIVLPGYSEKNKEWLVETSKKIKLDHEIRPIFWDHWTDQEKKFNPIEISGEIIKNIPEGTVNIIAKSIGTLVASELIDNLISRVQKVIFCGIPLNDISEVEQKIIADSLKNISSEDFLCFQNADDPHGSYKMIKKFLGGVNEELKVISMPRGDHNYPYLLEFENFLNGAY